MHPTFVYVRASLCQWECPSLRRLHRQNILQNRDLNFFDDDDAVDVAVADAENDVVVEKNNVVNDVWEDSWDVEDVPGIDASFGQIVDFVTVFQSVDDDEHYDENIDVNDPYFVLNFNFRLLHNFV